MSVHRPNKLGLFLLNTILYPGEQKSLHVFEPRYKEMVANCLNTDTPFVIVRGNERQMQEIGCAARIERVLAQYADGQVDIEVQGIYRVQIIQLDRTKLYHQGIVERYDDIEESVFLPRKEQLIAEHMKLLDIAGRTVTPQYYQSEEPISWLIGRNCGLSLDQRQNLLEMQRESDRIEFLTEYLTEFVPKVAQTWAMRMHIMSNGHFKDFPHEEEE